MNSQTSTWLRRAACTMAIALAVGCGATRTGAGTDSASSSLATAPSDAADSTTATAATPVSTGDDAEAAVEPAPSTADPVQNAAVAAVPDQTIALGSETVSITRGDTYTLTGSSSGGVVVETEEDVVLVLDGANIVSETGAAIAVLSAGDVVISLADGSENSLVDAGSRSDAEVNGTIYATADLTISGSGRLDVVAGYEDGIVTKDDVVLASGTVVVTAVDDGIRGRDSITVSGGSLTVTAGGDGLETTYADDLDKGWLHVTGGSIVVDAGDDGTEASTSMTIDGGVIEVVGSVEGLEALNITINDGDITIDASDDGINAAVGDIAGEVSIVVNGGTIDVTVGSGDTDAFDANGSLLVAGGEITVTAPTSSFDADGSARMTGGTVVVNGQEVTALPQGMGGGMGAGGARPGRP